MNPEVLEDYILDHISPEPKNLRILERQSNLRQVNGRMCSGHLQGRMLEMLTSMIAPEKALELGTFTGYSALCIAEALPEGGTLTTIEAHPELQDSILQAFSQSPFGNRINLIIGKALEVCAHMPDESFNLIFIDADKREYPEYFTTAKRLLRPGGFIIADNTLWDGHVVNPERNDPQTSGIKNFNNMIIQDPDFRTVIMPIRDGMTILRKTKK